MASSMIWSNGKDILDEAIMAVLPSGVKISSVDKYGRSAWAKTACIRCEEPQGEIDERFFIKFMEGEFAKDRAEGEYESVKAVYEAMPNRVPKPYGWGKLSTQEAYFFVMNFVHILENSLPNSPLPKPRELGKLTAELHQSTNSPTGKFGFHVVTFDGVGRQDIQGWYDDWTTCFTKLYAGVYKQESERNGPDDAYDKAVTRTISHLIPRLLGALEGIHPVLLHGDLHEPNVGIHAVTGQLFVFDAASFYGHNELEMGIWTNKHHKMSANYQYVREYRKHIPPSEPSEESDDRIKLYATDREIVHAFDTPSTSPEMRSRVTTTLNYLIEKYAPYGVDKPEAAGVTDMKDLEDEGREVKPMEAGLKALKV